MKWHGMGTKPGPRPKLRDKNEVLDSFGLGQIKPWMHGPEGEDNEIKGVKCNAWVG